MSQLEIADRLRLTQPSYSNLEGGRSRLTVDRAKKLAKILGCHLWELSDDFLNEPVIHTKGRTRAKARYSLQEFIPDEAKKGRASSPEAERVMDAVAALDPVLRITREHAERNKIRRNPEIVMAVYAATGRHIQDYELDHDETASEDYIRGVVAAKFEQFMKKKR
ncbi:MAG: helix-turn-helix transcriptional regulator [Alphaproteobacteria bacterium]